MRTLHADYVSGRFVPEQRQPVELNPRLAKVVKVVGDKLVWLPGGGKLTVPNTEAGKQKLNAALERFDRAAARELSEKDLWTGFDRNRRDDRPLRQRIVEDGEVVKQPTGTDNPYEKALAAHDELRKKPESMRQKLKREAAEWQEEQDAKAAEAERLGQPGRVKAMQHAAIEQLAVFYDPEADVSESKDAARRYGVAKDGTLAEYEAEDRAYRERLKLNHAQATAKLDQQRAVLDQQQAAIKNGGFTNEAT